MEEDDDAVVMVTASVDESDDKGVAAVIVEGASTKTKNIPWVAPRLDPEYYQAQVQDLGTMYAAPSQQLVEGDRPSHFIPFNRPPLPPILVVLHN